jgi:hypothetical protein
MGEGKGTLEGKFASSGSPNIQAADAAIIPMKNLAGLYWFVELAGEHRSLSTEEIALALESGDQARAISGPFLTMGEAEQSLERYWDMILSDDDD